ncbi:MAG TPA: hypothetical protein QF484_00310, partial [Candidatus Marinimicrobia bacterium]|nr:hypothetical protein [Candidatus Neomarinimicrobiota bacterium]
MKHLLIIFFASLISFNCASLKMMKEATHYFSGGLSNPEKADTYPELTERNRLMGSLPAERMCYNVSHYDLNLEIDMD